MNPFDLLVVWLATRIQLPERPPKPNARRDDFSRGADAVPDSKQTPYGALLILLLAVIAAFIVWII